MDSAPDDVEFLARSAHRVAVLEALAEGPLTRADLRAAVGASDPTIGRILSDFDDRGWVRRAGHDYHLTHPGAFVADHFAALLERLATERHLRDVWDLLPGDLDGFTLDLVADAVVTTVEPGDPYAPANRCASFYPTTSTVRGFDAALTAPHNFGTLADLIEDGLEAEFVLTPGLSRNLRTSYPDRERRIDTAESATIWWSDTLPMNRLIIFDDRVGVGGYDPASGVLAVYVDSDDPDLREWAVATFETFRREARPAAEDTASP